jgi:hypothetical protein
MKHFNFTKTILLSLSLTLVACGGDGKGSNDCNPQPPKEYSITQYQGKTLEYTSDLMRGMLDPSNKPAVAGTAIAWRHFALSFTAEVQTYYVQVPRFSLFASAYACSPSLGQARQTLSKISITSAQDFNAQYPVGSELANLFGVLDLPFNSVADLPASFPAPQLLTIFPQEQPIEGIHNFLVTITLDDGRKFEFTSGDIYLN